MIVGLFGESPNDTKSIELLLSQKYNSNIEYQTMLNNINGSQMDNQKTKSLLRKEYQSKKPNIVIFIRDLDSILPNKEQLKLRKQFFTEFNSVVDKKGIYLLNIFEIEALLLSDITSVNNHYNSSIEQIANPMLVSEPKEFLKKRIKSYNESQNSTLFSLVNIDEIISNCKYFENFIQDFDQRLMS